MADNYKCTDYLYDKNTLFIKCDCATVAQIHRAFDEAINEYQTTHNVDLACRFKVNRVENREGIPFGLAFVFVTNPQVYYMLIGKNPDGSDRIEYRDDPTWSPPTAKSTNTSGLSTPKLTNSSGWSTIAPPIKLSKMSWADETDEELPLVPTCPKIPFSLDPLMKLAPYHLTPEQIKDKKDQIILENEGKKDFDPSLIKISPIANFNVDRALAPPVEAKYMPNILKCKDIPDWVTKEDLKMQFLPYASNSVKLHPRTVKGVHMEENYPFININENRFGFVIFDPCTNDAYFALHMMKKTFIKKKQANGVVNTATLIFGHSYRTDRDMADINQRPKPSPHRGPPTDNSRWVRNKSRNDETNGEFRNPRKPTRSLGNAVPAIEKEKIQAPPGRFDLLPVEDD